MMIRKKGLLMELINLSDYEAAAQARLDPATWDFYMGGSDDEVTLRANRRAFERMRLRPRMLVDVSTCQTQTTVLGTPIQMPIMIAPTSYHGLAHPEAECATVCGAGQAGTLLIASTESSRPLEAIAEAASGPLWFQLYPRSDDQLTANLLHRAENASY
ncbi:MAG: alpha-hydroxy-acid oxidizing protein, partial [Ktedonobacteraceae bacterium]